MRQIVDKQKSTSDSKAKRARTGKWANFKLCFAYNLTYLIRVRLCLFVERFRDNGNGTFWAGVKQASNLERFEALMFLGSLAARSFSRSN